MVLSVLLDRSCGLTTRQHFVTILCLLFVLAPVSTLLTPPTSALTEAPTDDVVLNALCRGTERQVQVYIDPVKGRDSGNVSTATHPWLTLTYTLTAAMHLAETASVGSDTPFGVSVNMMPGHYDKKDDCDLLPQYQNPSQMQASMQTTLCFVATSTLGSVVVDCSGHRPSAFSGWLSVPQANTVTVVYGLVLTNFKPQHTSVHAPSIVNTAGSMYLLSSTFSNHAVQLLDCCQNQNQEPLPSCSCFINNASFTSNTYPVIDPPTDTHFVTFALPNYAWVSDTVFTDNVDIPAISVQSGNAGFNISASLSLAMPDTTTVTINGPASAAGKLLSSSVLSLWPTLRRVVFKNNQGPFGSAVIFTNGLVMDSCLFENNVATPPSPHVAWWEHEQYLNGVLVLGVAYAMDTAGRVPPVWVINSHFTDNVGYGTGGAIFSRGIYTFYVYNSTFTNNVVTSPPEAFSHGVSRGSMTLASGGAIFASPAFASRLSICNSTFKGNNAARLGAAVYASVSNVTIIFSVFQDNNNKDNIIGVSTTARARSIIEFTPQVATARIYQSTMTGNAGGIFAANLLEVSHSRFTSNALPWSKGAASVVSQLIGHATISNTVMTNNTLPCAVTIFADMQIEDCDFVQNRVYLDDCNNTTGCTTSAGDAVAPICASVVCSGANLLTVISSKFVGNGQAINTYTGRGATFMNCQFLETANSTAAVVYLSGMTVVSNFTNCIWSNNVVGTALFITNGEPVTLDGCVFERNHGWPSSEIAGAALTVFHARVFVKCSRFIDNIGYSGAGAIFVQGTQHTNISLFGVDFMGNANRKIRKSGNETETKDMAGGALTIRGSGVVFVERTSVCDIGSSLPLPFLCEGGTSNITGYLKWPMNQWPRHPTSGSCFPTLYDASDVMLPGVNDSLPSGRVKSTRVCASTCPGESIVVFANVSNSTRVTAVKLQLPDNHQSQRPLWLEYQWRNNTEAPFVRHNQFEPDVGHWIKATDNTFNVTTPLSPHSHNSLGLSVALRISEQSSRRTAPAVFVGAAPRFTLDITESAPELDLSLSEYDGGSDAFAIAGHPLQVVVNLRNKWGTPFKVKQTDLGVWFGNKIMQCASDTVESATLIYTVDTSRRDWIARIPVMVAYKGSVPQQIGSSESKIWVVGLQVFITAGGIGLLCVALSMSVVAIRRRRKRRQDLIDEMLVAYAGRDGTEDIGRLGRASSLKLPPELENIQSSLVIPFKDVEILCDIASGGAGKVSLGLWGGARVAVKRMYPMRDGEEREKFVREVMTHKELRHPNVVQLLAVCNQPLSLVLEFMAKGSLFDNLQDKRLTLPWALRLRFAVDIARGMTYLHAQGTIHRDLKSLNVLVSDGWQCKICDFDQSSALQSVMTNQVGTIMWSAPEVMKRDGQYDRRADVYSYGIMLWELWTRAVPYQDTGLTAMALCDHVVRGGRPVVGADEPMPVQYRELMARCLLEDAAARPTFSAIQVQLGDDIEIMVGDEEVMAAHATHTFEANRRGTHRRGTFGGGGVGVGERPIIIDQIPPMVCGGGAINDCGPGVTPGTSWSRSSYAHLQSSSRSAASHSRASATSSWSSSLFKLLPRAKRPSLPSLSAFSFRSAGSRTMLSTPLLNPTMSVPAGYRLSDQLEADEETGS